MCETTAEARDCSVLKLCPRMDQGSTSWLTTGCPAAFRLKWLKWFRVSPLFNTMNKGSHIWIKQLREVEAVRVQCISGGGPSFVATDVPFGLFSLPFSWLPTSAALNHSAARPTRGLLLGQSHLTKHPWNSWETPDWGSAPGPAVSPS